MTLDAVKTRRGSAKMLADVTRAAEARRMAETQYRSAILAAAAEHGPTATAKAAGVTRQAVRQLVARAATDRDAARLAELDASYDRAVAAMVADTPADAAGITAGRNAQAKRRAKRGLPPLPTVKAEALNRAETRLLALLEAGLAAEGFTPQDLEETARLRQREETVDDGIPF